MHIQVPPNAFRLKGGSRNDLYGSEFQTVRLATERASGQMRQNRVIFSLRWLPDLRCGGRKLWRLACSSQLCVYDWYSK